ncbi:hypothetical protein BGW80DRAFT_480803 [Lactifluus volemus]|nr:hypothetical protein BGW80DRAFT_480803 [Lactifluus volemus]
MLPIKAKGSWTRNLLRMASGAADARPKGGPMDTERGRGPARKVRIILEGPYSGPGYTLYTSYSGAVLVAGGSGVSYLMSVLDDMLQKHSNGRSHVRIIEVICRAHHRTLPSPSDSPSIGLGLLLAHTACNARHCRQACTSAQDVPTFMTRCKA